jgi:hypothetical protein
MSLPPDPDNRNDERAEWASAALARLMDITSCDLCDAPGDLLANLMHWADRNNMDFEEVLTRARGHYEAETQA